MKTHQEPYENYFLTTAEKQIRLNKDEVVKSNEKFLECLQQFVVKLCQKQVSLGYVKRLVGVSRKRNRKAIILRDITNARKSIIFVRTDTFKSQCQFCIELAKSNSSSRSKFPRIE